MFRVDPGFKTTSIISTIRGIPHEDYSFLELTEPHAFWILRIIKYPQVRFMFDNLPQALEGLACKSADQPAIYVVLPEHIAPTCRLTTSRVTKIWECNSGKYKDRRFEVTAECGVYHLSERGSEARRTLRRELIWACADSAL